MKFLSLTILLIGLQLITSKSKSSGDNSIRQTASIDIPQESTATVTRRGTATAANIGIAGIKQIAKIYD